MSGVSGVSGGALTIAPGWRVMFVDPGVEGTGVAYWESWLPRTLTPLVPTATAVLRPHRAEDWLQRFAIVTQRMSDLLMRQPCDTVVVEEAALWTGSATSMASGATGASFKLAMLIGGILNIAIRSPHVRHYPQLLPVRRWKGQLSKRAVRSRIKLAYALPSAVRNPLLQEHVADAVGMGLHAMGHL